MVGRQVRKKARENAPTRATRRPYAGASNPWGFPDLLPQTFTLPEPLRLLSYRDSEDHTAAFCHFFLDDYRFESVWNKPDTALNRIRGFYGALTPDFSLYTDWPLLIQQWNHYRRQWLGRYWQEQGIPVIPTVNWSTPESFDWCFTGIPANQTVALSVPDLRSQTVRQGFLAGFEAMIEAVKPLRLLIYGRLPIRTDIPCIEVLPDWVRLRKMT